MDNLWTIYGSGWWLNPTPLKNMSSSIGMMTFPIYGKIKNVPNHYMYIYINVNGVTYGRRLTHLDLHLATC